MKSPAILKYLAKILPTGRQRGNSLSFLLTSMTVMAISVSVTSVVMGPTMSKGEMVNLHVDGVETVADEHLEMLEAYIQQNPQVFLDPANWSVNRYYNGYYNLPSFTIPATTVTTASPLARLLPAKLLTYTKSIRVNNSNTPIQAKSEIVCSSSDCGLKKLLEAPYTNQFVLEVKSKAGSTEVKRRRIVVPELCTPMAAAPLNAGYAIPQASGESNDFALKTVSGPFAQFGTSGINRICLLPNRYTAAGSNMACDTLGGTSTLLMGFKDSAGATSNIYGYLAYVATGNLIIRTNSGATGYASAALSVDNPKNISVGLFRPRPGTDNLYRAIVFYIPAGTTELKYVIASWQPGANPTISTPATLFSSTDMAVKSVGYDPVSRTVVAAGDITSGGRDVLKMMAKRVNLLPTSPYLQMASATMVSTLPAAGNAASELMSVTDLPMGQVVVSRGGEFAMVPIQTQGSGPKRVKMGVFSLTDKKIGTNNNPGCGTNCSNLAAVDIADTDDLNEVKMWFNPLLNRYHWLVKADYFMYEWDPTTWQLGPDSGSVSDWMTSGANLQTLRNRTISAGRVATDSYTGPFMNVRKIGGLPGHATELWELAADPQLVFDAKAKVYYLRDVRVDNPSDPQNDFIMIDPEKGYKQRTPGSNDRLAGSRGQTMALDPKTGWVFLSSNSYSGSSLPQGLYVYEPKDDIHAVGFKRINALPSTVQFDQHNSPVNGDGNLVFSPESNTLFFLDMPAVISATSRPRLFPYQPYCYSKAGQGAAARDIPGFTPMALNWDLSHNNPLSSGNTF